MMINDRYIKYIKTSIVLAVVFVFGVLLIHKLITPSKPKAATNASAQGNSTSPGYLPMWSLESVNKMVAQNKELILNQMQNTPQSDYITHSRIALFFHKANDIAGYNGTYAKTGQFINSAEPDIYKYYDLLPYFQMSDPFPRLLFKDLDKQYFIEVTPVQQRDMIQKLFDFNVFSMENPICNIRFSYKREPGNKYYEKEFTDTDWTALVVSEVVYLNNTPKNKATIDAYIKWLEDNYLPELLKNPVDRWPWDW